MGAHALGAAAYAAMAARLAAADPDAAAPEFDWQVGHMSDEIASALRLLPLVGADSSGPLGSGLLASGELGEHIRRIQLRLRGEPVG